MQDFNAELALGEQWFEHNAHLRPIHTVRIFLNAIAFFNQITVLQCEQYHWQPYNPVHAMHKNAVALRKNRTVWTGL